MSQLGFQIKKRAHSVAPSVLAGFKEMPTANIADVMGRSRAMDACIKPINQPGVHLVGTAFTVRTHPSDNLMVHKAMDMAEPGDVIVVDACGDMGHAIIGEIMCHYARTRGIAGYVVDGPVRDLYAIAEMGYPVFARGGTPKGPYKEGPGEINTAISCGNVPVHQGDIIVGDDDGVVVIPCEDAEEVLSQSKAVVEKEKTIIASICKGEWDRRWVNETLLKKGCEMEE